MVTRWSRLWSRKPKISASPCDTISSLRHQLTRHSRTAATPVEIATTVRVEDHELSLLLTVQPPEHWSEGYGYGCCNSHVPLCVCRVPCELMEGLRRKLVGREAVHWIEPRTPVHHSAKQHREPHASCCRHQSMIVWQSADLHRPFANGRSKRAELVPAAGALQGRDEHRRASFGARGHRVFRPGQRSASEVPSLISERLSFSARKATIISSGPQHRGTPVCPILRFR